MSRPPAPSLRPVLTVVAAAVACAVLGRLFVGSGDPGVAGVFVVVFSMAGIAVVVLSGDRGVMPRRLVPPSLLGLFLLASVGAFAL